MLGLLQPSSTSTSTSTSSGDNLEGSDIMTSSMKSLGKSGSAFRFLAVDGFCQQDFLRFFNVETHEIPTVVIYSPSKRRYQLLKGSFSEVRLKEIISLLFLLIYFFVFFLLFIYLFTRLFLFFLLSFVRSFCFCFCFCFCFFVILFVLFFCSLLFVDYFAFFCSALLCDNMTSSSLTLNHFFIFLFSGHLPVSNNFLFLFSQFSIII